MNERWEDDGQGHQRWRRARHRPLEQEGRRNAEGHGGTALGDIRSRPQRSPLSGAGEGRATPYRSPPPRRDDDRV
jgi:hypothetical protein